MARELIVIGYHMWEHHNSILQHSEDSHQNKLLSATINEGIWSQFKMGTQDLPRMIRPMLYDGLHAVLEKPLIERHTWLNLVSQERRIFRWTLTPQRSKLRAYFHLSTKRKRDSQG